MTTLHHTYQCPIDGYEQLAIVIDLGLTQAQYLAGVAAGEYRTIVAFPNWCEVMGDLPAPVLPLTNATMDNLPFVLIRYISGGSCVRDALDDYMEKRSPNLTGG